MNNKIFKLLIFFLTITSFYSCSKIRFENDGIIIEAEIDGERYPMIMYNTKDGFDILDESTFDQFIFGTEIAGKTVTEIRFNEDPASYDYKNTNPKEEVSIIMYETNGFNFEYKEANKLAEVTTTDLKGGEWYYWNLDDETLEYIGKIKKIKKDYEKQQEELENQNSGSDPSNPLVGKWMRTNSCANINGESNWIQFSSNGTGSSFNADCNNACAGYGILVKFSYTYTSSSFPRNYNNAGPYCGQVV